MALLVLLSAVFIGTGVLIAIFIGKTGALERRTALIEAELRRLRHLEADVAELKGILEREHLDQHPATFREGEPKVPAPLPAATSSSPPVSRSYVVPTVPTPFPQTPGTFQPSPSPPSRTREEWEALIGGKLLNRIGALALIIGVGFFLKYAFDNDWITETMRVAIGFVLGAGLLVVAARAQKREFEVFAQGLVGAGLAVLYLSVFASFNFYHLVPQTVAFFLMSAVTIVAFLQAFQYDSLAVSLLGLLGGFLTPFLLSTGEASEIGLFTYIGLLDAGILAVLLMRNRWAILEPLSLGATYLVYLLWYKEYYTSDKLLLTVYLIVVFWVLFYALDVYRNLRAIASFREIRTGVAAANVLFLYIALYSLIEPEHHNVMGLVTLLIGLVYFGTALFIRRKNAGISEEFIRQVLTAIILLVLATAIEYTGFRTVQWWSVEALALIYCGVRWNARFVWISGTAVLGCALMKLLVIPESFSASPVIDAGLLMNQRAFTFALLSAAIAVSATTIKMVPDMLSRHVSGILQYIWPAILFALLTVETAGHYRVLMGSSSGEVLSGIAFQELMTLAVVWMIYALVLAWLWVRWRVDAWLHVSVGILILSVCMAAMRGLTYEPIERFVLVWNFRTLSMVLVVAGAWVYAHLLRSRKPLGAWNADVLSSLGVVIVVLLLCLITGETKDYFARAKVLAETGGGGESTVEYDRLSNLQQLWLSGVWLAYSVVLMVVGLWRRQRGIRICSIVLFGFTILKIFIYDLSFLETVYRIFSFIGLGVILLAVSYLYQRYKDVIVGEIPGAAADKASKSSG